MKTIAIILAGGSGKRMGSDLPKQFLMVNGKMIIEHTIEAFHSHSKVDEIAVVCHAKYTERLSDSVKTNSYKKVKHIIDGGNERFDSSLKAIRVYKNNEECKLLFHDAVRPLVSETVISKCIEQLDTYNAVGVGIPTTDTIWSAEAETITSIPDRRTIYRAQTPQGFKWQTINKAYRKALESNNIISTDDCGVVKHYLPEEKIGIVIGVENNFKITRKEDISLFKNILKTTHTT